MFRARKEEPLSYTCEVQQTCRNTWCKQKFEIEDADLAFLEKLSPTVGGMKHAIPPPTFCPDCRQQRRMSFRNERHLYRRKCDVTGQDIISVFPEGAQHRVCEKNHWYSDAFDPLSYGRNYDSSRPFFEQFNDLALSIPLPSLLVEMSENCEFNNGMRACKDCYLCSRTHQSQNMMYTYRGTRSSDCVDCRQVVDSSFLYECVECVKCSDSRYLFFCNDCGSSAFLLDCRGCLDCFMCCNLRNKRYCFLNEQLTKEGYQKKLKEFDFGSFHITELAETMYKDIRHKALRRNLMITQCEDVSGDNLLECKDCHHCFSVQKSEHCRYLWDVKQHRDSMDEYSGGRDSELMYETSSGSGSYDVQWCLRASDSQHCRYCWYVTSSKNIFGSIGLRRAKFCILNKQYSESEYSALAEKIIERMRLEGEWGEFFSISMSPFGYNDTVAQEFFPLSEKRAKERDFSWQKEEKRISRDSGYQIPDSIASVKDDITEQPLVCEHCRRNYKIVDQELAFYRRHNIPLPRKCVDCRYMARLSAKNPPVLRDAACAICKKKMQTSYPKDTDMRIVCETCYQKEVV